MAAGRFQRWFDRTGWRALVIGTPYLWLVIFFLLPFLIVLAMSVATNTATAPPFSFGGAHPWINPEPFTRVVTDGLYLRAFLTSVVNAFIAMLFCLLIGYPMALALTRVSKSWRTILLMLVILPFWTSFLLRVYAWMGLMGRNSWFNGLLTDAWNVLVPIDWAVRSVPMMNTNFAVVLVMVYTYLPFMILPLYSTLSKMDLRLLEAANDLGATPWKAFWLVTVPLSKAGIIAGSMLVFIPCIGEFVIPELLGGPQTLMIGRVLWDEFFSNNDWPMASSVAIVMILLIIVPLAIFNKYQAEAQEKAR